MSIHIALIGRTLEPVLNGIREYGKVEKLFLLHSPNSADFRFKTLALEVKKRLKSIGLKEVILQEIDAFDMLSIVNAISTIGRKEAPPLYINITGGTNLMAGAACAAAYFIGAIPYYVQGRTGDIRSKLIELPVPSIPSYHTLGKTQIRILEEIYKHERMIGNGLLRSRLDMSPQKLSYHIRELENKRLVLSKRGEYGPESGTQTRNDRRALFIELTNAGMLIASWHHSI